MQFSSWKSGTEPEQRVYPVLLHFMSFSTGSEWENSTPMNAKLRSYNQNAQDSILHSRVLSLSLVLGNDLFKKD